MGRAGRGGKEEEEEMSTRGRSLVCPGRVTYYFPSRSTGKRTLDEGKVRFLPLFGVVLLPCRA